MTGDVDAERPGPADSVAATARSLAERLLRGGAWALLGRLLAFPVGLALAMLLARVLSPGELGGYFLATSLVMLAAALVQLGLGRAMVKLVAAAVATDQPLAARQALRTGGLTVGAVAVLAALAVADGPGVWLIGLLRGGEQLHPALPWIALLVVTFAATEFSAEVLRGFHDLRGASLLTDHLLQRLLFVGPLAAVWLGAWSIALEGILALACGAALLATLVGALLIRRQIARLGHHGSGVAARVVWRHGPPFLLLRLNFWLLNSAGIWILGMFRPPEEVALYGAASYLALLVLAPFTVVNSVLAPVVAELYSQGRIAILEKVIRGAAALSLLPGLLLAAVLSGFGELTLTLVFGASYSHGVVVLAVLALARAAGVACGASAIALTMTAYQRDVMLVTSVVSAATFAAYLVAAPTAGAEGIALVTALSILMQNGGLALLARRRLGIATWPEVSAEAFARLRLEFGRARRRR